MEYGEVINFTGYLCRRIRNIRCRFRVDPIPFTGERGIHNKRWFCSYYKRPKSTQEKRLSYSYKTYVRGKRSSINLPNSWDDMHRSDIRTRKSWKKRFKCRKQWGKFV